MYAIFVTGGKQYRAAEGDTIYVEKLDGEAGQTVVFDQVLLAGDKVGTPLVDNAENMKPLSIAVEELYEGKVKIVGNSDDEAIS